ncbi:MAG: energy transducer TonB [Thermoanaerobaculia bacterium]
MFETSLIESQKRKAPKNRALIIQMALLMHVLIIGTVLAVQYWTIDPVDEPPIQVSFVGSIAPPPPPPPPPPPAAPKPVAPKPVVTPVVAEIVQPVAVPDVVPEPTEEVATEGTGEEGVEGGVEGGVAGGDVGGVPQSTGDEILRVGGEITKPERLGGAQPAYTELARKARIQGVVIVEAVIDKEGRVTNVRVLKGLPMGLDQSAVDAVKNWRFKPATLNGRPVSVYYSLTVNFRLQ